MFELIDSCPLDAFMAFVLGVSWLLQGALSLLEDLT